MRITSGLFPAMAAAIAAGLLFSGREYESGEVVRETVFPLIRFAHPVGSGTFLPGSFAANFFLPSLALMVVLNLVLPSRVSPLLARRAKLFYYIFFLVIAIVDIGADTLLPMIALRGRWGFGLAVTFVNGCFFGATALAAAVARGTDREW